MTNDLTHQPAHVQLQALDRGEISSRELLDLHLARIEASQINAVVTRDDSASRAAAHAADERRARNESAGILDGLPLTIKDSFETVGLRTTSGAEDLADHVPARDADAVARLRHQGAVIMGKTNTPAYCQDLHTDNALFGPTLNPHDPKRTTGGSSGGPAAAVAAYLTPADLGSDLAGSLRLPAHYCGVYGLRPTHGLVPARGHIPRPPGWITSSDMVTPGPLARHPRDLDLLLAALTTPSPDENTPWSVTLPTAQRPLSQLRVAVWADDARAPSTATRPARSPPSKGHLPPPASVSAAPQGRSASPSPSASSSSSSTPPRRPQPTMTPERPNSPPPVTCTRTTRAHEPPSSATARRHTAPGSAPTRSGSGSSRRGTGSSPTVSTTFS
ncbi:amidase family protein [Streptomyces atroolivaceus]|uniref:amidase n=1 Tax=Streptomyces atroolivaceus TaxID=66869 RepID=UPI0033CA7B75